MAIRFQHGALAPDIQKLVSDGFLLQSQESRAPDYEKTHVNWVATDTQGQTIGVLTADLLWDWVYIDELWVSPDHRGEGLGRQLMQRAEAFAGEEGCSGVWLWTQSWQAEQFYSRLGYSEFTRFENFPKGHSRIGFRKTLA